MWFEDAAGQRLVVVAVVEVALWGVAASPVAHRSGMHEVVDVDHEHAAFVQPQCLRQSLREGRLPARIHSINGNEQSVAPSGARDVTSNVGNLDGHLGNPPMQC